MPVVKYPRAVEPLWHEWDGKAQKCGLRHTVYAVNGDQYTGEWLDNLKHGKGTQIWKRTGAIYSGDWKFGKRDGYGSYSIPHPVTKEYKKVYTGWWKNDKKCGCLLPGKHTQRTNTSLGFLACTQSLGSIHKFTEQIKLRASLRSKTCVGLWMEQKAKSIVSSTGILSVCPGQGKGCQPGMLRAAGDIGWVKGHQIPLAEGYGTMFYPSGECYEGEWSGGLRSGWGRMCYGDGSVYEGQWLAGQPGGQGMLCLSNENRYEGGWKDGKKHGPGRFFYLDKGQLLEGIWVADIPKCGIMIDFGRDEAPAPTQYPIPKIELADPDAVLAEAQVMFDDNQN